MTKNAHNYKRISLIFTANHSMVRHWILYYFIFVLFCFWFCVQAKQFVCREIGLISEKLYSRSFVHLLSLFFCTILIFSDFIFFLLFLCKISFLFGIFLLRGLISFFTEFLINFDFWALSSSIQTAANPYNEKSDWIPLWIIKKKS